MKSVLVAASAAIVFLFFGSLSAADLGLEAGVNIYDGGSPLAVNYHSACTVADWNEDGKKDLIVSQFYYGWVWLYLNQGTNSDPVFNGGTQIESNGSPITTTYG